MKKILEVDTERLILRQWRQSDREPFAAMNADPKVMEFFPSLLDHAQSDALADKMENLIAAQGWGFWAVEQKNGDPFIGCVGLHIPEPELPFGSCIEIGWRLASNQWGNGFASEAATAALNIAFDSLKLNEIVSFTAILNQRSQAVMKRIGMTHRAEFFDHPSVKIGHPLRAHILYRVKKYSKSLILPTLHLSE